MIVFLAGLAAGGYLFDKMTSEQRSKVLSAARNTTEKVKGSKFAETVADNASEVSDAATRRTVDAVDAAGDKATDAVRADRSAETKRTV